MVSSEKLSSSKPLRLKQRTSSLDTRRDYSHNTWWSLLVLLKVREYFVTVDNFSIWRRHLAWAMENGKDLRAYMTQRYGSSMVFMSLLLSTELSILFNGAPVTTGVREALREGHHGSISFWAGLMIIISSLLTVLSLIASFTAWGMVNSIDEINTHCIFRSSIGQYAAELPGRLIVCSIYFFLISFMMFFFLLLPVGSWSIILSGLTSFLFIHIVSTFSAFGRVIMHTGAMGNARIFSPEFEECLVPHTLHSNLLMKATANLENNSSIIRQYRRKQQPIDRYLTEETMYDHLSGNTPEFSIPENNRPRADSTVRFADADQSNKISSIDGINNRNSINSLHNQTRTLTHLSDLSQSHEHGILDEKSTPTSSLRKSSYGGLPLPRRSQQYQHHRNFGIPPPPPPLSGMISTPSGYSTVENVSTTRLEEWLHSTNTRATAHATTSPAVGSNKPSLITTVTPDYGTTTSSNARPDLSNSTPIPAINSNSSKTNVGSNAGGRQSVTSTNDPKVARELPVTRPDKFTPLHSMLPFDHALTDDERFTLDYGDIEGVDITPPPGVGFEYQILEPPALRKSSNGRASEQEHHINDQDDNTGELVGLLDQT